MTWKLYAMLSAGGLVATYLVSSPAADPAQSAVSAKPAASRLPAAASDIEALAERLHVRLRTDMNYREPGRDPFRFQTRPAKPTVIAPPPTFVDVAAPPPAPVLPPVRLTGIAADVVDGKPQRAAILSLPNGVLIVRVGESVAGLYTVVSIGEESMELEATVDGSRRTLRLSER